MIQKIFWTAAEDARLADVVSRDIPRDEIEALFPNRTWDSIRTKMARVQEQAGRPLVQTKEPESREQHEEIEQKILEMLKQKTISVHDFYGKHARIGLLGDTQCGSLYERNDVLVVAYKLFKKEGIETVYHTGDVVCGENIYRGQVYETWAHGLNAQLDAVEERYPCVEGITTFFITGNHDLSFWRSMGGDIGTLIPERRKDFKYLGREEHDVILHESVRLRLCHPGGGTAYAISYKMQRYIESLSGGHKPNVIAMGHFHKMEQIFYRNIHGFQTGCLESQTPFMKRKATPAHVGFWILDLRMSKKGITSLASEFFPYYETSMEELRGEV